MPVITTLTHKKTQDYSEYVQMRNCPAIIKPISFINNKFMNEQV